MSPEPLQLPRKWFAAAAVCGLLLAAVPAAWLLLPALQSPAQPGPSTQPENQPRLRQSTAERMPVPWGGVVSGGSVRIEVVGADEARYAGVELFLTRDDDHATVIRYPGFAAELTRLAPGRYRWRAHLHARGPALADVLEPPRGAGHTADFIVPPPVLVLTTLRQHRLDGGEIGGDLQTESGALLSTQVDYPGAVLEVEVKPSAKPFDGHDVQRIPATAGTAQTKFRGPDGPYHWRARLTAGSGRSTAWREFKRTPQADFVISHQTTANNAPHASSQGGTPERTANNAPNPGPKGRTPGRPAPVSNAFSSGLGSGRHDPFPSQPQPLPSLWDVAFIRLLRGLGFALPVLAIGLFACKVWKRRARRPS